MSIDEPLTAEIPSSDLYQTDERYDFRLTDILRRRRRPLLLLMDGSGEVLSSSVPQDATASEHRLFDSVVAEARILFAQRLGVADVVRQVVLERPGQKRALFMVDDDFFSLTVFPIYAIVGVSESGRFAALVEPIGLLAEGIDFFKVKEAFRLSNRELDVLRSLMSGHKDKEIARDLGVSAGTIRAYLKSIRAKLRVTTRTAIVHRVHELSGDAASSSN